MAKKKIGHAQELEKECKCVMKMGPQDRQLCQIWGRNVGAKICNVKEKKKETPG